MSEVPLYYLIRGGERYHLSVEHFPCHRAVSKHVGRGERNRKMPKVDGASAGLSTFTVYGYLVHKKTPTPLGPP